MLKETLLRADISVNMREAEGMLKRTTNDSAHDQLLQVRPYSVLSDDGVRSIEEEVRTT